MNGLTNPVRNIFAEHLSDLGLSASHVAMIERNNWQIVWAQRPISSVGRDERGDWMNGIEWESNTGAGHGFMVAADPTWRVSDRETLADRWNAYDAYPIQIVTRAQLESRVKFACDVHGYDFDEYVELYGGDVVPVAANILRGEHRIHDRAVARAH